MDRVALGWIVAVGLICVGCQPGGGRGGGGEFDREVGPGDGGSEPADAGPADAGPADGGELAEDRGSTGDSEPAADGGPDAAPTVDGAVAVDAGPDGAAVDAAPVDGPPVDTCGDGMRQAGEACDDGNRLDGDYCAPDCSAETGFCGDGEVQLIEACDDGNRAPDDYCAADCLARTGRCGDGEQQGNERCDDGNVVGGGSTRPSGGSCPYHPGRSALRRRATRRCGRGVQPAQLLGAPLGGHQAVPGDQRQRRRSVRWQRVEAGVEHLLGAGWQADDRRRTRALADRASELLEDRGFGPGLGIRLGPGGPQPVGEPRRSAIGVIPPADVQQIAVQLAKWVLLPGHGVEDPIEAGLPEQEVATMGPVAITPPENVHQRAKVQGRSGHRVRSYPGCRSEWAPAHRISTTGLVSSRGRITITY